MRCAKCGCENATKSCAWYVGKFLSKEEYDHRNAIHLRYEIHERNTSYFCNTCATRYIARRLFISIGIPIVCASLLCLFFVAGLHLHKHIFYTLVGVSALYVPTAFLFSNSIESRKMGNTFAVFMILLGVSFIIFNSPIFDNRWGEPCLLIGGSVALSLGWSITLFKALKSTEALLGDYAIGLSRRSRTKAQVTWNAAQWH